VYPGGHDHVAERDAVSEPAGHADEDQRLRPEPRDRAGGHGGRGEVARTGKGQCDPAPAGT
jgi:hypothetical protein